MFWIIKVKNKFGISYSVFNNLENNWDFARYTQTKCSNNGVEPIIWETKTVAANKSRPSLKHVGRQVRADFPRREGVNRLHLERETAVLAEATIYTRPHIFFCFVSRVHSSNDRLYEEWSAQLYTIRSEALLLPEM